ncbi:MAG: hypothetical protein IPK07_24180 [Deltaproteobacteria bacterium]|nr:hypothetical protein [Deltaproteobacteria bacterium]
MELRERAFEGADPRFLGVAEVGQHARHHHLLSSAALFAPPSVRILAV